MATDSGKTPGTPVPGGEATLEGGSYEVIRARLHSQADALATQANDLNARRKALFGGTELTVIGNERVRTENNCVPRDIVSVGKYLLFGYNVFIGLKKETVVSDVFSLHRFEKTAEGFDLSAVPSTEAGGFLADPRFVKDFGELYKYYKDAKLLQLRRRDSRLLAVFQTGQSARDLKVFRFNVDVEGRATYVDNQGERDHVFPPSHDFEWTVATREQYVLGQHPHVNVLDQVFVETVKGDLTIKVEDNTTTGLGIYSEPVDDPDQSLDDAEFAWTQVGGLILLRVLPFREKAHRYLVFNARTQHVVRIDAIGQSCVRLPEDQGIVFPGGYYLQTGDYKVFDGASEQMEFHHAVRSPNGEDVLYVFHRRDEGSYVLFPYNLVRKEVQTPLVSNGMSLFADGGLVVFRATSQEPTRVHPMQVWQTPFVSDEHAAQLPPAPGYLGKVGNAELVRGISDALTLPRVAKTDKPTRRTYEDLVSAATRALDAYYWLNHAEVGLQEPIELLRRTSELIIDEFEKVLAMRKRAEESLAQAVTAQDTLLLQSQPEGLTDAEGFMRALADLRRHRGHLITLKDIRYMDLGRVDALEQAVVAASDAVSTACVDFLQKGEALQPLATRLDGLLERLEPVTTTAELAPLVEDVERTGQGLEVLGEVVGGLQVGDPLARARILEGISELFSRLNRVRAGLQARRKELSSREKRAEFGAQFKLLGQSIENALSQADAPEKCDEALSRLTVMLEELEGRFGEFDEFLGQITQKREELLEAFGARKQSLVDERQRRASGLFSAAERILQGVQRRAKAFKADDELNAYFASDAMILKLRQLAEQLLALQDSVRSDEVMSRVKSAKQDALRALRDRQDLFEGGEGLIKLGPYRFHVNTQPLDLTLVPRDGALYLQLTGSDYTQKLEDPELLKYRELWEQHLVSETRDVYRSEYLAAALLLDAEEGKGGLTLAALYEAGAQGQLLERVRAYSADRFDEGYERGVHDADAVSLLEKLLALHQGAGLLRFAPVPRAWAALYWAFDTDDTLRGVFHRRAQSLARLRQAFDTSSDLVALGDELGEQVLAFLKGHGLAASPAEGRQAGRYLVEELAVANPRFTTSREALAVKDAFLAHLDRHGSRTAFDEDLRGLEKNLPERLRIARAWVDAFLAKREGGAGDAAYVSLETAVVLITERKLDRETAGAITSSEATGLLGSHPRVQDRKLPLRLDEFLSRLGEFRQVRVPAYMAYRAYLRDLLDKERRKLRLEELTPKVLTSFVRNRLIDEVYLPLIGANLAKQLGAAGEGKRTDRMGMLLLMSPPGYGKTTLMEYVASRLGLTFVKVNGPALGHSVKSLDPSEAPNATARQEVERINLSFEMGNNVMLYLDDIQHTDPELLQKFISLCDGQRRVEGVWNGQTRTYDLRGKKFCVVMAGNPYTETGERFRIPDMLANRADTYNLGDILDGKEELFALSYLENALTSNPVLAPLATRDPQDVHRLIRMAKGEDVPSGELKHGYAAAELQEIVAVFQRLFRVQQVLLKVNLQYIASAAQDERFRTEPPFKLQGSYRNMGKMAEKVVSAMTDDELERRIDDHYQGESQTLTTAAEQNLLKLAEMRGRLTPEKAKRWEEIKQGFARVKRMGGKEDDPVARVTGQLGAIEEQLGAVRDAVVQAAAQAGSAPDVDPLVEVAPHLEALREAVLEVARVGRETAAKPPPVAPAPVVVPSAPATDLAPYLKHLAQLLKALTERVATASEAPTLRNVPLAAPAPDFGPYLAQLSHAITALADRPVSVSMPAQSPAESLQRAASGPSPAELSRQIELVEGALLPLERAARRNVQGEGEGIKALQVWQGITEALELLRGMLRR
ncbi:AAA family ATPase [Corallococcus praedator]|uniref:AAA family ATPase n=1 Tax=Corallococcus praedator TaxID=2316724 RepID=A0ABX9QQD0_9BACT|nr:MULTISPECIES: DNA repair ATPase [Corallococcus]RKH33665.1 AAA family ATPase [Corallococcus sp. CA031C]RKI14673.1 AAA family ATPase [Corallococcus praedator]